MASVRSMYVGMAEDEQGDKITEGKAPMQVMTYGCVRRVFCRWRTCPGAIGRL